MDAPVVGMVARLVDQKGLDILTEALPDLLALGINLVILGTGEERYHRALTEAAESAPHQMRVQRAYDEAVAKGIYAGCDMFLMPSQYEPCGLNQIYSLRYGTIPVVRATGGLQDTIVDFDPKSGEGTGFKFDDYTGEALLACIERALRAYRAPQRWQRLMQNAMAADFSWDRSARAYAELYERIASTARVVSRGS